MTQMLEEKVGAEAAKASFDPDWGKAQDSSVRIMEADVHNVTNRCKSELGQHGVGASTTVV